MPYIKDVSEGKAWQGWNTGGSQTTWNTSTKTCFQILSNQMPGFGETASEVTHTTLGRPGNTQRNRVRKHQGTVKLRCGYQPSMRIERLATRLVTGMRHLPYEEKLQRLGLHSLQRRRLQAELITAFKMFKGLLDININLIFPSSRSTWPRMAPLQGSPRCEPPPKEGVGIFGEGCQILE